MAKSTKSSKKSSEILETVIDECNIYEGGGLSPITSDNLIGNPIAIRQLINSHNLKVKEATNLRNTVSTLEGELSYLRTSPFISIVSVVINLSGTIIIGFAINLLTQDTSPPYSGWVLIIGVVLVITGSISTILYPFARKWFNSQKIIDAPN